VDVTTVDLARTNTVTTADGPMSILWSPGRGHFLVPATCRHRGGPLHLGDCADDTFVVCPWHGGRTRVPAAGSRRAPLAFVRVGRRLTLVGAAVREQSRLPVRGRHRSPQSGREQSGREQSGREQSGRERVPAGAAG
jgi:hypothetical protein